MKRRFVDSRRGGRPSGTHRSARIGPDGSTPVADRLGSWGRRGFVDTSGSSHPRRPVPVPTFDKGYSRPVGRQAGRRARATSEGTHSGWSSRALRSTESHLGVEFLGSTDLAQSRIVEGSSIWGALRGWNCPEGHPEARRAIFVFATWGREGPWPGAFSGTRADD